MVSWKRLARGSENVSVCWKSSWNHGTREGVHYPSVTALCRVLLMVFGDTRRVTSAHVQIHWWKKRYFGTLIIFRGVAGITAFLGSLECGNFSRRFFFNLLWNLSFQIFLLLVLKMHMLKDHQWKPENVFNVKTYRVAIEFPEKSTVYLAMMEHKNDIDAGTCLQN